MTITLDDHAQDFARIRDQFDLEIEQSEKWHDHKIATFTKWLRFFIFRVILSLVFLLGLTAIGANYFTPEEWGYHLSANQIAVIAAFCTAYFRTMMMW